MLRFELPQLIHFCVRCQQTPSAVHAHRLCADFQHVCIDLFGTVHIAQCAVHLALRTLHHALCSMQEEREPTLEVLSCCTWEAVRMTEDAFFHRYEANKGG